MEKIKTRVLDLYRHKPNGTIVPIDSITHQVLMPGDRYFAGVEGPDEWGVRWTNMGPNPQFDGNTPTPGYTVLEDAADWEKAVHFPDYSSMRLDGYFNKMMQDADRENKVVGGMLLSGTFERMHALMGMENAMCAFYEEPEAVCDFLNAIADSRIAAIDLLAEYIRPDVILMHDDWGMEINLLLPPEIWREFIKPVEKRYADHIHSKGMLYEHHSCGFVQPLIEDMIEIGIDALNPLNVCNDVEEVLQNYGKGILILGGLNARLIDTADSTEEQVRAEVRRAIDSYAGQDRLYLPYYIPTNETRFRIVQDEITTYGNSANG